MLTVIAMKQHCSRVRHTKLVDNIEQLGGRTLAIDTPLY
jgi:hypothetical protein